MSYLRQKMGEVLSKCRKSSESDEDGETAIEHPDAEPTTVLVEPSENVLLGLEHSDSSLPFLHGNLTIIIHKAEDLPNTDG